MQSNPTANYVHDILRGLVHMKATEVHFVAGQSVSMKMKGHDKLTPMAKGKLTSEQVYDLAQSIMTDEQGTQLEATGDCEFEYIATGIGHFRAHAIAQHDRVSLELRAATAVPTTDSRGMLAG
jgi:Tfp pilus assembly ATPase PilU